MRPGPITVTVGSYTLLADSLSVTYETQPFDRVEFDHEKLRTVALSTSTQPQIVSMLGGRQAEVTIDCALSGMIGGASSYVPRPLGPNSYPTDFDLVKQRVNISRYKIGCTQPESAVAAAQIDGVLTYLVAHKNLITSFNNRLAIFGAPVAYEILLLAQNDDIEALYFTTAINFSAPGYPLVTGIMVVDSNINEEFAIPDGSGNYSIYKTFDLTLEQRTVSAASA